ncbi:MAG: ferredoxin [bacterium]|nr:ferredoxin [bacterium]
MPKIIHYRKNCIGCNACVELDPKNWKMNAKDGKADLIDGKNKKGVYQKEINEIEKENAQKSAESCPVNIIKIEE